MENLITLQIYTSISANANRPCDASACKIANTTLHAKRNHQASTLWAIFKAHCYTGCHLSVINTYNTVRHKLHLVHLLSTYNAWSKFTTIYARNKTDGAWVLVYQQHIGERNSGQPSTTLLISVNGILWRNLSKSQLRMQKWVTWAKSSLWQDMI